MKKAGISESINVTSLLYTSQKNKELLQLFDEISTSEINGAIIVDTILNEKRYWDEYNNMLIEVEVASTIFKYSGKPDPTFSFKIERLKEIYNEEEKIFFSFTPSQDGFLTIFTITENEIQLLYPYKSQIAPYLDDKNDSLLLKNKTVNFPIHPAYKSGYTAKIKSDSKTENSTLIFVFVKQNIQLPFTNLDSKSVFRWIYGIPINQKVVQFRNLVVSKN